MADSGLMTTTDNGDQPQTVEPDRRLSLPGSITMNMAEMGRVPSPGTQRRLKAEVGRTFDELVGPDADSADRYQTFIWIKLRREHAGLRWAECDEVEIEIDEESVAAATAMNPTKPVASTPSLPSVASGD